MIPRPRRPAPSYLERATVASLKAAPWVDESDQAAVALLRDVMLRLDQVRRQALTMPDPLPGIDPPPTAGPRDFAELAGRGVQLLRDLGLTPAARYRLGLWNDEADDAFAEVVRLAAAPAGNGSG